VRYDKPDSEHNDTSARDCETVCVCNVKHRVSWAHPHPTEHPPNRPRLVDPWAPCDCPYCKAVAS
jgi:hypothetical protein